MAKLIVQLIKILDSLEIDLSYTTKRAKQCL